MRHLLFSILLCLPTWLSASDAEPQPDTVKFELVEVDPKEISEDPAIIDLLEPYRKQVAKMRAPIGEASETMPSGLRETSLGSWMADVIRESASRSTGRSVDMAFTNCGGIRAPLPEGVITEETLLNIMPFDNSIVVYELNSDQMDELARDFASGYGYFPISGMTIEADADGNLLSYQVGRKPVSAETSYLVATSDYLAGSYRVVQGFEKPENTGLLIRDEMIRSVIETTEEGAKVSPPEDAARYRYDGKTVGELKR